MSLKYGKAEVAAMAAALDPEYAGLAVAVADAKKELKDAALTEPEVEVAQEVIEKNTAVMAEIEHFAAEALGVAEEVFEKRAKFVVVGQLTSSRDRLTIPPNDPEAIKLSLGWYSTEGDAEKAAASLWFSTASGDTFRTWVLPVHHGTAADLHSKRKEQYAEADAKADEKRRERLQADIAARDRAMEERAKGGKGSCEHCAHQPYEHGVDGSSRGKCLLKQCACTKWKENTKRAAA